ncbi:MAG: hypothetical protein GXP55_24350, partial [Deltaproteobacteria bacterium]|nr:hypothetical protein [Deltaproteobacteria bacterium]
SAQQHADGLRTRLAELQDRYAQGRARIAELRDAYTQEQARTAGLSARLAAERAKGTRLAEEVESVTAARLRIEDALAEARRSLTQRAAVEATPSAEAGYAPASEEPAPDPSADPAEG